MSQALAYIIPVLAVAGFAAFVLYEISTEPLPRYIDGPAMEVDQGSKVITLLVPVIARVALPLLSVIFAVCAALIAIAWVASLDAVVYRLFSGLFSSTKPVQP